MASKGKRIEAILFEHQEDAPSARIIDFTARHNGLVRRALSHEVVSTQDNTLDDLDFNLLAVYGRRSR